LRNRNERRLAARLEKRAFSGGPWPPWEVSQFPPGSVGGEGWTWGIREAYGNGVFAVLVRYLDRDTRDPTRGRIHLAIRTATSLEPPWRDLQRIKNEIVGPERWAVQFYPPAADVIDAADMYHLWVMPVGYDPGMGLHRDGG
jgi:hypothetical protein